MLPNPQETADLVTLLNKPIICGVLNAASVPEKIDKQINATRK